MYERMRIPGLALLTLSLTDCVDRKGGDGDGAGDPIVGDWYAVKIDGETFPMIVNMGPYMIHSGLDLRVSDDLRGSFMLVNEIDYDDYLVRYEQGSTIVVDASAAPKYRIDVKRDPFGDGREEEGYDESYGPTSVGYGSEGYDSDGYDTAATSGGYDTDGGSGGGVLGEQGAARPLQIPLAPRGAPADMVLRCTLDGKVLSCQRDGDDEPKALVFQRSKDD